MRTPNSAGNPRLLLLLAVLLSLSLLWLAAACQTRPIPAPTGPQLLLTMLDVGQADSLFLKTPSGRTMLVDAGNERADVDKIILPYLKRQGVTSLDYLVLTHPDQDHVGGMPVLLESVGVGSFLDSVQPGETNQGYLRTLQLVQSKGVKAVRARRDRTQVDLGTDTQLQILEPEDPLLTRGESVTNNNGVVLRVTFGAVSALLAADIGQEGEERLLSHHDSLQSQILKVAHHGSRTSSSNDFLRAVKPEVALISAGAGNSYGHPHTQTLERLDQYKARIYRTDRNGTIEVTIDGQGYRVSPEKQGG